MEKSKAGTSRKDRDEARESKVQSDLQEETTFFNEQISIQKLQSQVKELEARNKILISVLEQVTEQTNLERKKLQARNKKLEEALTFVKLYLSTKTVEGFEAYTIAEQALNKK